MTEYDDGRVACGDQEIIIRHYYAPVGAKHIKYRAIREVRQVPLGPMGKWRIHGSGDFTPDDPGRVMTELAAHG